MDRTITSAPTWVSFAVCAIAVASCTTGTTGAADRVRFEYRNSEILVPSAEEGIAEGAEVAIELERSAAQNTGGPPGSGAGDENEGPFRVERAESSNPEVLRVVELEGGSDPPLVRVKAESPGRARIEVESTNGPDRLAFRVGSVSRVDVSPWLAPSDPKEVDADRVALLQGGTGRFRMTKYDKRGSRLIGGGVEQYLEVEPSGSTRVDVHDPKSGSFELVAQETGSVRLRGRPSETDVEVDVVEPDRVEVLNLYAASEGDAASTIADRMRPQRVATHRKDTFDRWPVTHALPERRAAVLVAVATSADGARVVGLGGVLEARSETPQTCSVRIPDLEAGRWVGDGLILAVGKQSGTCRVKASLGEAETTFQFAVVNGR
jgi:hypothetical protein